MNLPELFVHEIGVLAEHRRLGTWLQDRGVRNEWCSRARLRTGAYPLGPGTLVAGSIEYVHAALEVLSVPVPSPLGFPGTVAPWLHRRIDRTTAADAIARAASSRIFAKPAGQLKLFTGGTTDDIDVVDALRAVPGDTPVFVSEPVTFLAEWRVLVAHGTVRSVTQYLPDVEDCTWPPPDRTTVAEIAAAAYDGTGRDGLTVDLGMLDDGRLCVVELNDGYAIGSYHAPDEALFDVLWARWTQLTGPAG